MLVRKNLKIQFQIHILFPKLQKVVQKLSIKSTALKNEENDLKTR